MNTKESTLLVVFSVLALSGVAFAKIPQTAKPPKPTTQVADTNAVASVATNYIQFYAQFRENLGNNSVPSAIRSQETDAQALTSSLNAAKTRNNNLKVANAHKDFVLSHNQEFSVVHTYSDFSVTSVVVRGNTARVVGVEYVHVDLTVKSNPNVTISPEKADQIEEARRDGTLVEDGEVVHSSSATDHDIRLVFNSKTGWKVDNDIFINPYMDPVANQANSYTESDRGSSVTFLKTIQFSKQAGVQSANLLYASLVQRPWSYNRKAAAQYADMYCKAYNPRYSSYGGSGKDCANFISQCVCDNTGGTITPTDKWRPYSTTWIRAGEFFDYMVSYSSSMSKKKMNRSQADEYQRRFMTVGDVIGFYPTLSHVSIVVLLDSNGNCYYDAHTEDRYHTLWDQYAQNTTYHMVKLR